MAEVYNVTKYVLEELRENRIDKNTVVSLLQRLNEREDIAVIGMGVKYSNIEDYRELRKLLREKRTLLERCPKARIDLLGLREKEEAFCKGSFIQDIACFDPEAFSMTQEEAADLTPACRVMLEAVYRTLEDGGCLGEKNADNRTGVFLGSAGEALRQSGIAASVARVFDLRGGAYGIDAGSVSSDIAIVNACQAIRSKQCKTAIAGGLFLETQPLKKNFCSDARFAHEDSVLSRSFDKDLGGLYLAEGAAAVLLKPLAQALEDGDRIHGVICGHSMSSSGNGESTEAVEDLVKNAVESAQIDISDVDFLEFAGTPEQGAEGLELAGLRSGFGSYTDKTQFCGLGSLSGTMGELQSAAGVFRLIRLCLAMQEKTLPAQYRFNEPTDTVNLLQSPFYVSDYAKSWPAEDGKPRQSAMYACGNGTHVMLFLQEAPEVKRSQGRKAEIFVLSAATKESFRTKIEEMIAYLPDAQESLTDICYTANVCRPAYRQHRLAVLCRSKQQLAQSLEEYLEKDKAPLNMFVGQCKEGKSGRVSVDGFTMEEVATGFSEGTDFMFDELFDGVERGTAELPPYPFEKQRCWKDEAPRSAMKTIFRF